MLVSLRQWFSRRPSARYVGEGKVVRHFKRVKTLCNCHDCYELVYCHGLCKAHRDEKRSYGYAC